MSLLSHLTDIILLANDTNSSLNGTLSSNTTTVEPTDADAGNADDDEDILKIPLLVIIIFAVAILAAGCITYRLLCVSSKNKRKIYVMMQEAKLESDV